MILTGASVKAPAALKDGILDEVAQGDVLDAAAQLALSRPPSPISKRPVSQQNKSMVAGGALEQGLKMASQQAPGMVAHPAIITCLRTACSEVSFQEGLKVEMHEFVDQLFGLQSGALRHLFYAERAIAKVPGLTAKPGPIKKIGIL